MNTNPKFPIGAVFCVLECEQPDKTTGFLIIQDIDKPAPHFWKFVGGRTESEETETKAMVRELYEELGIKLSECLLEEFMVLDVPKGARSHSIIFYRITKKKFLESNFVKGIEIGKIKIASKKELESILAYEEMLPRHAEVVIKLLHNAF